ncbi:DgyrCDS71 [Dimorphilus gyrociliatus]|uniref:DgyrCDS71 n=1 Tax=Dimorphilus gyrociliatus TaxID=2664684 RepID=A0A7I8V4U2_9ANNE|nr:DgyrCDS71 [Dimorphilus gyrociliatus]
MRLLHQFPLSASPRSPSEKRIPTGMQSSLAAPKYIKDMIVPITIDHPEEHSDRVRPFTAPRLTDPSSSRVSSSRRFSSRTASAKSSSTFTSGQLMLKESPVCNQSAQAHRFETEQKQRAVTRALMRSAQIQSHRVDNRYVMCGMKLGMKTKFSVDESELEKLRAICASKQFSQRIPSARRVKIPRQPTPSNIAPSTRQSSAKARTVVEPEEETEEETKQEEATSDEKGNEDVKENPVAEKDDNTELIRQQNDEAEGEQRDEAIEVRIVQKNGE